MKSNENFNMIVKKFVLNELLLGFTIIGYIGGGITTMCGFMAYWSGMAATPQTGWVGLFFIFLAAVCNCLWYCLQEYDKKYGLFNGWDDGCEVCKSLCRANVSSFSRWKEYKLNMEGYVGTKWMVKANGHPLYCPNCGRKLSSLEHSRCW